MSANRNKESIELDLKSDDGRAVMQRLVRRADVLIENFRPGTMDRLGFSAAALEELNPRLILLSISGFGHDGPEGSRAGYDQIAQGEAGLMSVTGTAEGGPSRIGVPIADVLAGVHGAAGVSAALAGRERSGRGVVVRTSLLAAAISAHTFQGTKWTVGGQVAQRSGNQHPQIAPYGSFRCRDGYVQIAVGSESLWPRFAPIAGIDCDERRFATNADRVANREDDRDRRSGVRSPGPRRLLADLEAAGVPSGAIRTIDEVYEWDQTRSQGLLIEVDHSAVGRVQLPGPSLRFESADGQSQLRDYHDAPPVLGEDTDSVLRWLDQSAHVYNEQVQEPLRAAVG